MKRWEVNELRAEIPVAQIAMILVNQSRDTTKHPQPLGLDQFLIVNRKPKKEPTPEEQAKQSDAMVIFLEMLNARYGGKDLRVKKATA